MKPDQVDIAFLDKVGFDNLDKINIISYVDSFAKKSFRHINNGRIELEIKEHKEKTRGISNYYCRLKFWTDKGLYVSENSGFGYKPAIHGALEKIERRMLSKKQRKGIKFLSKHLKYIKRFPAML